MTNPLNNDGDSHSIQLTDTELSFFKFVSNNVNFWIEKSSDKELALYASTDVISLHDLTAYLDIEIPQDLTDWADSLTLPAIYWTSTFSTGETLSKAIGNIVGSVTALKDFIFARQSEGVDFNEHPTVQEIRRVMEVARSPYTFRYKPTELSL